MRTLSTFALEIQRGEDHEPSRVSVVLSSAAPDADGVLRLSPQFMTLDELEGSTLISAACGKGSGIGSVSYRGIA